MASSIFIVSGGMGVFAIRIIGAAVELSIFSGTEYQSAAAAWASARCNGVVFLLFGATDVFKMLFVGLLTRLQLSRLDSIAYLINLGPGEPLLLELIYDLAYLAPVDNAGFFDLDFYIGLAGEGDDRQYWQRLIILQDTSQRTDVAGILQDRVVELVFVTVDVLRPVFGVFTTINPAVVVLGLDDEDAIY